MTPDPARPAHRPPSRSHSSARKAISSSGSSGPQGGIEFEAVDDGRADRRARYARAEGRHARRRYAARWRGRAAWRRCCARNSGAAPGRRDCTRPLGAPSAAVERACDDCRSGACCQAGEIRRRRGRDGQGAPVEAHEHVDEGVELASAGRSRLDDMVEHQALHRAAASRRANRPPCRLPASDNLPLSAASATTSR